MAAEMLAQDHGLARREGVDRALAGVDGWLANSRHEAAWHQRLDRDSLRGQLARKESADLAVVERWLQRLTADAPVAAHAPIAKLRRSVEGWLATESLPKGRHLPAVANSILRSPTENGGNSSRPHSESKLTSVRERPPRGKLRKHLVALTAMLSRYAEQPSDDLAQSIDDELLWLEAAGEASSLVDAVQQYYGHPDVWIDVSKELLDDSVVRKIERNEPVTDVIQGTPVSGAGRLSAQSELVIEPDSDRAVLKILVRGQVDAQTTGHRGPARLHSRSTTTFRAEKRLVIQQTGLRVLPTECSAQLSETSSGVSAVRGGLRGRIIARIAQRRWDASRDAANQEAARHVEQQVAAAVDREADELIGRLDRFVIGPMLALANGRSKTTPIQFCSDEGVLRIGVRRSRLGAPPGMPPVDQQRLFTVRLHSSLVRRLATPVLVDAMAPVRIKELSFFTPSKAFDLTGLPSLFNGQIWQGLAWGWLKQTVSPRFGSGGIALRDGRWGTLTPGEFAGDWPLLGWQPPPEWLTDPKLSAETELSASLNRSLR